MVLSNEGVSLIQVAMPSGAEENGKVDTSGDRAAKLPGGLYLPPLLLMGGEGSWPAAVGAVEAGWEGEGGLGNLRDAWGHPDSVAPKFLRCCGWGPATWFPRGLRRWAALSGLASRLRPARSCGPRAKYAATWSRGAGCRGTPSALV